MSGLVAVPCLETVQTACMTALRRMIRGAPHGSSEYFDYDPFPVHVKREKIGRILLQESNNDLSWVLMVDSDMLPPEAAIPMLEAALKGHDIVGGLCFARRPPYPVCAGFFDDDDVTNLPLDDADGELRRVDWVGTGCVMIRRRVFELLPQPWFTPELNGRGEDINFMRRATDAGLSIACATGVQVGHLMQLSVDLEFVRRWSQVSSEAEDDRRSKQLWSEMRPI